MKGLQLTKIHTTKENKLFLIKFLFY